MRWIETDTASNVNISSATAIGAYTADADRLIIVDVCVDAIAGGGDYVMYVTKQIGGSGSAYIILPKTTMTAAAGETAISGQSGLIAVRSGDVLTVYVDGLAGDTSTPDYTTRWFEMAALKPATADRTIDVDANGKVILQATQTGVTIPTVTNLTNLPTIPADWLTAAGVKADAVTKIQAGLALTTHMQEVEDKVDIIDTVADAVKAKTDLITTGTTITLASPVSGSTITAQRGDSLLAALTNIGALTNYSKLWFTAKKTTADADTSAIVQIEHTAGLTYINGAVAITPANGTLAIDDETTGDVTIGLAAVEMAKLDAGKYVYDIQVLRSAGTPVSTLTEGTFIVPADVTRATA